MRLTGYERDGQVFVGAVSADGAVTPLGQREQFWACPATSASDAVGTLELGGLRLRPAIPAHARIACIGLNYRKHAEEGGAAIPELPVVFARWTASTIADGDPIWHVESRLDWEAELGIVIGKPMYKVPAERALDGVYGYCVYNDVSARRYQRQSQQWAMGKNGECSGPMSMIATADEVGDPAEGLRIGTRVNGETMQDSSTADMIFDCRRLIAYVSEVMVLKPGDLIITGTPEGVGFARNPPIYLQPGDTVECEVERVGRVTNKVIAAPDPILP
jgi:2-keto-4-pentenoate hydratase/2-oxohepta-3-ene-1,7-dioic acid hydratase in catechol pathway